MTNEINVTLDASGLGAGLHDAGEAMNRIVTDEIEPAAALIEDAFAAAAGSIQSNLASAAESGVFSIRKLTSAISKDLSRYAIDNFIRKPIETLVTNALTAPFGGGRAGGGVVAPGQAYLVGERGPELFTPSASGRIEPRSESAGAATIHIHLPAVTDAESFRRSETQITAALARAVGRGRRSL